MTPVARVTAYLTAHHASRLGHVDTIHTLDTGDGPVSLTVSDVEALVEAAEGRGRTEALREAARILGHASDCHPDPDRDPYLGCRCRVSLLYARADDPAPTCVTCGDHLPEPWQASDDCDTWHCDSGECVDACGQCTQAIRAGVLR